MRSESHPPRLVDTIGATNRRRTWKVNWPLLTGLILVLMIAILAIKGPELAPRDPLERVDILHIDGRWETPPYGPLTPGFPLGSDQAGRDILSRLLWGIRPTMILVMVVAAVRLVAGLIVGLISGWSRRWIATALETLTAAALAIPALLVALAVLLKAPTPPGFENRLWIFILALSITGWAETARVAHQQTQLVRGQAYVEAARALGASGTQLLRRHVLPHLMPWVWILFAFEVGGTLLLTGSLGFLGLFVGGLAPTREDDPFILSGRPELGEMLASTIDVVIEPWGMVAAGTVVFLTVLGFNLVSLGLRIRLRQARFGRRSAASQIVDDVNLWLDEHVVHPLSQGVKKAQRPLRMTAYLLVLAALALSLYRWRDNLTQQAAELSEVIEQAREAPSAPSPPRAPAGQPSTTPPQASQTEVVTGEPSEAATSNAIAWSFEVSAGSSVAPWIAPDGTVYMLSHNDELYALSPTGELLWQVQLQPPPYQEQSGFRVPATDSRIPLPFYLLPEQTILIVAEEQLYALDSQGQRIWESDLTTRPQANGCCQWDPEARHFYLLDQQGGLTAFNDQGESLWTYQPEGSQLAVRSRPVLGPGGSIFYAVRQENDLSLHAVTPEGEVAWISRVPDQYLQSLGGVGLHDLNWLRVDPSGTYVHFDRAILTSEDGLLVNLDHEQLTLEIAQYLNPNREIASESLGIHGAARVLPDGDGRAYFIDESVMARLQLEGTEYSLQSAIEISDPFSFPNWIMLAQAGPNDLAFLQRNSAENLDQRFRSELVDEETYFTWTDFEREQAYDLLITRGERIAYIDPESTRIVLCSAQRNPDQMTCRSRLPFTDSPDWEATVPGVNSIKFIQMKPGEGVLYVFSKGNIFYKIILPALG